MENIFENAKFGDKFLTRDNKIAIYAMKSYLDGKLVNWCLVENTSFTWGYDDNGMLLSKIDHDLDIVSRYQEPIDEDKLDELANAESPFNFDEDDFTEHNQYYHPAFIKGYKAGYRKAKEELE